MGCSIGYYLAKAGIRALVMEKGRLGREASGAALGVLEACSGDQPYQRLKQKSLSLFHELSGELREGGGIDIELVRCGQLLLALTEKEEQSLRIQVEQSNELGSDDQWLDHGAVHSLESALAPQVRGGMYAPDSCRVNNQRLSEAFARAGAGLGAQFKQGSEVIGLLSQGNRVTGARLYGQDIYADQVVLAGGPWTCAIAGWLGVQIPVRPVRGQHVNLQTPGQLLKTVVRGSWGWLVPRNDGSVLAGATVEEVGFDNRITAGGVEAVLNVTSSLVPSLKEATLNWAMAGLRPGSPDDMPLLGPVHGWEGLVVASGHYRNGILLSPVSGQLIANYLTGKDSQLLSDFGVGRFHT